jgi:hypothetical protein
MMQESSAIEILDFARKHAKAASLSRVVTPLARDGKMGDPLFLVPVPFGQD